MAVGKDLCGEDELEQGVWPLLHASKEDHHQGQPSLAAAPTGC